jgi:hypothetical protein
MAAGPGIPGYVEVRPIGRGGLGDVYRAVQESTGREVAIKVLRDISDTSVAWHRTRRELNALLALSGHANVIQIVELLELDAGPALVMEYAPGGSLADLLERRGGTLTAHEAVFVGRQVAAALVAAHERGIVHRDIKPGNLLIDEGGQVKVCDFGIAAITRDPAHRDRTDAVSLRYASPEDLEHDVEVRESTDIYSLGATLLHLAHGAPPTLKDRLAPWEPPFVDDRNLAALDRVIARCLQPNPSVRPTAAALLEAFSGLSLGAGDERVTELEVVRRPIVDDVASAPPPVVPADAPVVDVPDLDPEPAAADVLVVAVDDDDPLARLLGDRPLVRPEPTRGHARHVIALVAAAAVVATFGAVLLWPADDASAPTGTRAQSAGPTATAPAPSTVPAPTASIGAVPIATLPRPDDLAPLESVDWTTGAVGDCLVQVAGEEALVVVGCAEAHDLQRVASGSTDDLERLAEIEVYDADLVRGAVTDSCAQQFVAFVGNDVLSSELGLVTSQPSATSWAEGDRAFACYVGIRDMRVVGDARRSGW